MNAVSPIDLPLRMVCCEKMMPDYGPVIMIGLGVIEGTDELPPRHAVQAAEMLLDHALSLEPDLIARQSGPLASIMERLWQVVGSYLPQMLKLDHCANLRGVIDREVRSRVTEELIGLREATRRKGLGDAAETIRRLVLIANEPDDRARAIALSAIHHDIAGAIADLDSGLVRR